jgi:ubiquinone/menaquinone biosynthesis C-methylase UbiE
MRATEAACLEAWRAALLAPVAGAVLELGAGTGANLAHYPLGPAGSVRRLVLAEPDHHMRGRLRPALPAGAPIELVSWPAEAIAAPAASFDCVVATLVMCSVNDLDRALQQIHRVLRPGGSYHFLEHVAAEEHPGRLRWQRRIEPVWKHLMGNCHLTRRTEQAIRSHGFVIDELQHASLRKAPPWVRPTIRGIARKPA